MKKFNRLAAFLMAGLLMTGFFVSCGKVPVNEFGFYEDLDAAVKAAKKSHKRILLYVMMEGLDDFSNDFRDNVLATDAYKDLLGDEFISVYFDFGESSINKTTLSANANAKEVEAKKKVMEQVQKNVTKVRLFEIQDTPSVFLMTEDGYCFFGNPFDENFSDVNSFAQMIRQYEDDFFTYEEMIAETKKGTPVERVNAIYDIYQSSYQGYEYSLAPLYKSAAEIDKKDESGQVSELYMTAVYMESMNYMAANDYLTASQILKDAAQTGYLKGEEKQNAFYMAGELLLMANSTDYQTILSYLNASVMADPESEAAEQIRNEIAQITAFLSGESGFTNEAEEE